MPSTPSAPSSNEPNQPNQPPLIAFDRVTIVRGTHAALDDVSLSIEMGEHVAIIGPNGSGKSTLIKAITRELYPSVHTGGAMRRDGTALPHRPNGTVRLLGRERWNVLELRAQLGIVSNDLMATCTREVTGRDVVISGFFSSIGIWPNHHVTDAMRAKADEILARLHVPHLANRFVTEMSSGEARRMLIGRALVHDPRTLLLDEPTNSLDLQAMQELRDLYRHLAQTGTGILLVTHHLPDIIPEIDRVILIKDGRVFRDGAKAHILTAALLGELFGLPVDLAQRDGYYNIW